MKQFVELDEYPKARLEYIETDIFCSVGISEGKTVLTDEVFEIQSEGVNRYHSIAKQFKKAKSKKIKLTIEEIK